MLKMLTVSAFHSAGAPEITVGFWMAQDNGMKIHLRAIAAAGVVLIAAGFAHVMTPHQAMALSQDSFNLDQVIPTRFGDWTMVPGVRAVVPAEQEALVRETYSQTVARGYVDHDGHVVFLLVAYGPSQAGHLELHNPETCYVADGFSVSPISRKEVSYRDGAAPLLVKTLIARRAQRFEPISYWMVIGDDLATSPLSRQFLKLKYGLRGFIPDGLLIRVSTIGLDESQAYQIQDRFIRDLIAGTAPEYRKYLVGASSPAERRS
jgi:EpsI family protein